MPTRVPWVSSSPYPSPTPTTPIEITQQLQRVEALHQQLKVETQRAREFLAKIRRGELEAQTQAQLQLEQKQLQREEAERRKQTDKKDTGDGHGVCSCNCPHHPNLPPPSTTNSSQIAAHNRNSFGMNTDLPMPPIALPTRVDEREVRDLEKRVRGLEGRVRGFEGLPPDREMALLEVERLRRELEGLARRREGLFEGLGCDEALKLAGGDVKDKVKAVSGGNTFEVPKQPARANVSPASTRRKKSGSSSEKNGRKGKKRGQA